MNININNIKIKDEFINGEHLGLDVMAFFSSKNNLLPMKVDSVRFIENIENGNPIYLKNELLFKKRNNTERCFLKNYSINKIIEDSVFEPFSFWFIKNMFNELFEDNVLLKDFLFQETVDKWRYRKFLWKFLEFFTNIEDVSEQFIKELGKLKEKSLFVDEYRKAQTYLLLNEYICRDKKRKKQIQEWDFLSIDGKTLIIQPKGKKKVKFLYGSNIYFCDHFRDTNLFV
jgi:hypothetical protein